MRFLRRTVQAVIVPGDRLIVGLGNPGIEYQFSRHNVGFMVVEDLANRYGLRFRKTRERAEVARGDVDGVAAALALPVTFMNESGNAVRRLVARGEIPLADLLVVCDDIDLPFGTLRLRPSGGSGGHNGLKSIIHSLGSEDFPRLRLGVGRPRDETIRHVLGPFSGTETAILTELLEIASQAVVSALLEGVLPAMNQFNKNWLASLGQN